MALGLGILGSWVQYRRVNGSIPSLMAISHAPAHAGHAGDSAEGACGRGVPRVGGLALYQAWPSIYMIGQGQYIEAPASIMVPEQQ